MDLFGSKEWSTEIEAVLCADKCFHQLKDHCVKLIQMKYFEFELTPLS